MTSLLLLNPRSGTESPTVDELAAEAQARGIAVRILRPGDDAAAMAAEARAEILGVAGGEGSLAEVAEVPAAGVPRAAIDREPAELNPRLEFRTGLGALGLLRPRRS